MSSPPTGRRRQFLGFLCVVGATLLWSAIPICVKFALAAVDAYTIAWMRFAVGGAILCALARGRGSLRPLARRDIGMTALAAIGIGSNYVFYIRGVQDTTASAANVVVEFEVVSLVIMSRFWLKERVSAVRLVGMLVTFLGVLVALWNGESIHDLIASKYFFGNMLIFVAAPLWALYGIAQKILADRGVGISTSLVYIFGIAALVTLAPAAWGFEVHGSFTAKVVASLVVLVVVSTAGAYLLMGKGFEYLDASTAGMITCLLPIFTITNAHIFLGEVTTPVLGAGAVLVVLGILIIGRTEARQA